MLDTPLPPFPLPLPPPPPPLACWFIAALLAAAVEADIGGGGGLFAPWAGTAKEGHPAGHPPFVCIGPQPEDDEPHPACGLLLFAADEPEAVTDEEGKAPFGPGGAGGMPATPWPRPGIPGIPAARPHRLAS